MFSVLIGFIGCIGILIFWPSLICSLIYSILIRHWVPTTKWSALWLGISILLTVVATWLQYS